MKKDNIIVILLALYILHDMPILGYRYPAIIYALLIIVLFLLLVRRVGVKTVSTLFLIFMIPILNALIQMKTATMAFMLQQVSNVMQLMILPLSAIYVLRSNNVRVGKIILGLFLLTNFITCITTYTGCLIYPGASRDLTVGDAVSSPYYYVFMDLNIGGFSFVYSMVLFTTLHIFVIKNFSRLNKGRRLLLLSIIYLIVIGLVVIGTEFTMALLMYVLLLMLLFVKRTFQFKHILIGLSMGVLLFWTLKPLIADILMTASENIESYNVAHRLSDLSLYLEGKQTSEHSDMDMRSEDYNKSVNAFFSNPLGSWEFSAAGGHSYVLDSMARYGVLGVFLLIIQLYLIFKRYIYTLRNKTIYGYAWVLFLFFILMGSVNPKMFTNLPMFVLPLYAYLIQEKTVVKFLKNTNL